MNNSMATEEVTFKGKEYCVVDFIGDYILVIEKDSEFPTQPLIIPNVILQKLIDAQNK